MQPLEVDGNTFMFGFALAFLSGVVSGVFPAIRVLRANLLSGMNSESHGASSSRSSRFVSSTLVCGQIALALVLLVGAALLIHSFGKVVSRDMGFEPKGVTTLRLSLAGQRYQERSSVHDLQRRLVEAVTAIPAVDSVGLGIHVPLTTGYGFQTFNIFGYTMSEGEEQLASHRTLVSPGYFQSLGIKLLEGEFIGTQDVAEGRRGIVISKTLADKYFQDVSPIGRKLGFVRADTPEEDWPQVVGVVDDVQHTSIDGIQGAPFIYERGP